MTTTLPAIQTKRSKQTRNIVKALKELQGAVFRLSTASSFCAQADMLDVSKNLREMASAVSFIMKHLREVYKSGPVDYNTMRMFANLETIVENVDGKHRA
jgi:hypothetical protein